MKIDINKVKKGTSEVPSDCQAIIQKLKTCYQDNNNENLLQELQQTTSWTYGKCELFHWVDVLNIFDDILEHGARRIYPGLWSLAADTYNKKSRDLLLEVLRFTTLLIEHSFSRHLYNSMEHLLVLMGCSNLEILNGVLNLLYMFSKRSNFIPRLHQDSKSSLLRYLTYLAESWGGRENGFGLASCCQEDLKPELRDSATTLHFEYYDDTPNHKNKVTTIHIENIDQIDKSLASIMDEIIDAYNVPESQRMVLFTQLRLAHGFPDYERRLLCVQARLQAISVLVYSNGLQDNTHLVVLYTGLLEELVELLELSGPELVDIRAAALRTLTSVIHLDRNPHFPKKSGSRLTTIIDVTGAANYHGQLPTMVRTCIASLIGSQPHEQARVYGASVQSFPLPLATALFSFLFHLASYEAGGKALVSCGMMESLLKVINWPGEDLDQITFVIRAVRVIDLITNIDMTAFQTHQGLASFINRLESEVNMCRKEQPFEIVIPGNTEPHPDNEEVELTEPSPAPPPPPPPPATPALSSTWRNPDQDENAYNRLRETEDISEEPAPPMSDDSASVHWTQTDVASSSSSQKSSDPNQDSDFNEQTPSTSRNTCPDEPMEQGQENNELWVPKIIKIFSNPEQSSETAMEVDEDNAQNKDATPAAAVPNTSNVRLQNEPQPGTSSSALHYSNEMFERSPKIKESVDYSGNRWQAAKTGKTCLPQRAALIKSILNFLKKAIQDQVFSESMRTVMEGSLPSSLKHVISNSDYYGPSLFLLATDVVTVYIYQEPSLLFTLQDNYLTDVVLQALLVKEVPATREVLASLPNVISALCLNARGLNQFKQFHSFDHIREIFVHPLYLPAMRRRRSSDPLGDTATTLGNAMDELMRHHPDLKTEAMKAVINLLDEIYVYGTSPQYVCESYTSKKSSSSPDPPPANTADGGGSSDEDEEEDKETPSTSYYVRVEASQGKPHTPIPLIDYIHNVMKFVDAILSNNSTEDHCKEFVSLGGLKYVVKLLSMPNLPADYAVTPAAQAVANVCKSILSLAHEPKVLEEGLKELQQVLTRLEPLTDHSSGKCVLLHELAMAPDLDSALYSYNATPLLHSMAATHGFVIMFVHVCRTGQSEVRNTSIFTWGSPLGLDVLHKLSKLYTSLVWESTLLLALCSDDVIPADCDFGQQDLNLLLPQKEGRLIRTTTEAMNTMKVKSPSSSDGSGEGPSFTPSTKNKSTRVAPTPEQLKHLKLLLGAASRLGRALAELFGLLVKLCVGSQKRRVTFQHHSFLYPPYGATYVAKAMSDLLARGLNWNLVPPAPLEKFKLTYLICSVGFTSPMLFDDKKQPYHMIMHYFNESESEDGPSGLTAFFDSMYHALAGEGSADSEISGKKEFPDGTGEFLDAWLMLLEKMTNPRLILDSPNVFVQMHEIENAPVLEFCPYKYLVKIHRMAFSAIMEMWGRKPLKGYGFRMTDSMLCILKHILVGKKILQERLDEASAKQISLTTYGDHIRGGTGYGSSFSSSPLGGNFPFTMTSTPRPSGVNSESQVNETLITQLCDMGFSREAAVEALSQSMSIEMAISYLVENSHDDLDDLTILEGITLQEVIGCSSGNSGNAATASNSNRDGANAGGPSSSSQTSGQQPSSSSQSEVPKSRKKWRCEMPLSERESEMLNDIRKFQLSQETMNKFTENVLVQCLEVLENLPETVYRVCDLLIVICDRNGFEWCENMLENLCNDISVEMVQMLDEIKESHPVTNDKLQEILVESTNAKKVSVRLHLLTLLFDDLRFACVRAMSHTCLVCFMILLLQNFGKHARVKDSEDSSPTVSTPKWVAPLLLLLDLYEKTAVYTQRMHAMHNACTGVWKWFQLKTGKWTLYTTQNNKLINLAYWSGSPGCRVSVGENGRRYQINFNTLSQINEDTGRGLPITMSLRKPDQDGLAAEMTGSNSDKEKNKEYDSIYNQAHNRTQQPIESISEADRFTIVEACVKLMQIPVDTDALHAAMRLTLRLTRDYPLAKLFAEKGGVTALLNLEQDSNFTGFTSLATLIFRHIMEEPSTLRTAIERTIRARISTDIQPFFRELLFLMRHSEAGICRNPELYLEIAQKVLRVEYNVRDDDKLILKYVRKSERTIEEPTIDKTAVTLIRTLLDQLVEPDEYLMKTHVETTSTESVLKEAQSTQLQNKLFAADLDTFTSVLANKKPAENKDKEKKEVTEEKKSKKLLSKSAILSVLTDAVKSYVGYSKLIMDQVFEADPNNPILTEDMTAVRFILEKFVLLPGMDKESLEMSAEARLLLGAVGACNHSTAIQSALVLEVKNCIQRIVNSYYEDTKKKYNDVSCILSLISDMMMMCPPASWVSVVNNAVIKMKNDVAHLSNISKLFTRKGLINELARLPHNLDLSNPNFVFAMNAALKPLETLTKLAIDPGSRAHGLDASAKSSSRQNSSNRPAQETGTDPTMTNSSGTTSGNTNAQGEETNEDTENTENDLSAAAESLEPASDGQVNDDITDIGEIVLEDQNMDRDNDRGSSMHMDEIVIPSDRVPVENDDLPNSMTLQNALMQMTSEMVHGLITELQPSNQEQLTDPDDPDNLEEDQYGDEQMEEDNNEVDEGGYNNENDDPDDDFLMDTSVFSRPEHLMNDLFFVQYQSNDGETLGSFNELYGDESMIRLEEPAVQNPPPVHHPLLIRRNREEPAPARNPRSRPRRYQFHQFVELNPRSPSTHRPDLLQNLLFSRRHFRAFNYRQGNDQEAQNSGGHSFRNSNLILMENGFGMLTRPDEENIDLLDQSMAHYFGHHLSTNMQSVCYVRWATEMKILDADSAAMAATVLSYRLRPTLEIYRDEEAKAKNTNQPPAMDIDSPPNTSETNKNVEMTEVFHSTLETNAIDVLMHLPHQTRDAGDGTNPSRANPTTEPNSGNAGLTPDTDSAATESGATAEERNGGNTESMPEAPESNEDSNPRDSFTPYFMFDDDHEARPQFPARENSEEMTEEGGPLEQVESFDMNTPSQDGENEMTFVCWHGRDGADVNPPLRRVPGSISIAPAAVPPAVYPWLSSPPLQEMTQSSEASTSDSQCETQTPPAPLSNDSTETNIFPQSSAGCQDEIQSNETLPHSNAESIPPEAASNRTTQQFPDFLPSMFGQSTENSERSPTPTQPPAPVPENNSAASGTTEVEPASSNAVANANDIGEGASPVPLDPEEMIQLYPNGRATYRGISIPAGLDPSFLAALPSDMREEVFSNHLQQQNFIRADQALRSTTPPSTSAADEVNPEFLAALPLNIQEEVLAQQRQERQRQVAASANPNDPFDAAAFFQNLPSSLRQSILADIEESQISVLPPDLAAEAHNLRREHEARNRHYFQERERILNHNTLSSILRGTGSRGARVAIHSVPSIRSPWEMSTIARSSECTRMELSSETTGRQLLDQEAVSTLLVLLFVQDFRLNINRLHRVITNLCCHPPTRDFVIRTLISIMEKCNESRGNALVASPRQASPKRKIPRSAFYGQSGSSGDAEVINPAYEPEPTWLNLSMDAALGCRVNVFQVLLKRYGKRTVDNYVAHSVSIHPQAAPVVVRKAMDLLFTLTKVFQNEFLPKKSKESDRSHDNSSKMEIVTSFWEILVRLENLNSGKFSKKGKSALKNQTSTPFSDVEPRSSTFDKSLMGHLVMMLTCPLIKGSTELTDKLLHILNLVSEGFTEINEDEAVPITEEHLKIIVNVLTSNGCTENGLEQATNLLIRMSNCPDPTRITSLKLLISGAREVASLVKEHIEALLMELREANAKAKSDVELEVELKENHRKGQIQDRFTKKSVVITAPSKVKGGFDIQLPAMQPLISKTSSQSFFLRILKVIIQLREVLVFRRKIEGTEKGNGEKDKAVPASGPSSSAPGTSPVQESPSHSRLVNNSGLMEPEETPLVSLYHNANEDIDDGPRSAVSSMNVDVEVVDNSEQYLEQGAGMEDGSEQTVIESRGGETSNAQAADTRQRKDSESDVTMDTDSEKDSRDFKPAESSDKEDTSEQFPSLTKQLQLDDLWITLSECLTELEKTPDHQAALILQPAVEAFFLVHSTAISECRTLISSGNMQTSTPRRGRSALTPIFPTRFSLRFGDLPERSQQPNNVLVSVTASDVLSGSGQGSRHINSQGSRPGQNQSFGYIISEYRQFIQASGAMNSSPLTLDNDADGNSESGTSQASHPVTDINSSTSLATFFKQTESSPLLDPFKFLRFAELHRAVLNQILRQSVTHLADGPFAILVNFTRVLDFDVKRKFFRRELEKMDDGSRRGDETTVNVNRSHVFEESFRELHRKSPEEWKNKFYVVFESEEGQDAGGLLREWYMIISREIFNPDYALFTVSPGDRVTYTINPSSHCNPNHLLYFKFVGRLIAKAIYDSKYLECYFTRSFYKHILGVPVKYQDMESEDPEFYEGLVYLKNHKITELGNDLTFTTDVQEFGVTESRELKPNGANIPVTDENKMDYIHLVCQMKMTGAIRKQLDAFLEGFYEIIPKQLISIFNEQELELLISGLPNIDIDDLKNNTEYNKYSRNSMQIVWFWRALREMDSQDQAKFLQFVTGTSKVPLQGFAALEGMNGIQKFQIHRDDRSTDRLPSAHTCFNQLDLPAYETYTKLKNNLLKAIHECSEGFGFA